MTARRGAVISVEQLLIELKFCRHAQSQQGYSTLNKTTYLIFGTAFRESMIISS